MTDYIKIKDDDEIINDDEISEVINYAMDNVFILAKLTFLLGGADKVNAELKKLVEKYKKDDKKEVILDGRD